MRVRFGYLPPEESIEALTYPAIPLPNLRNLCIRSKDDDDDEDMEHGQEKDRFPDLELAEKFLSHLNPYTLTIQLESRTDSVRWRDLYTTQSSWTKATSPWDRINSINFVDLSCLAIKFDPEEPRPPNQKWDWEELKNRGGCSWRPMALSWTFSPRIGGYATESDDAVDSISGYTPLTRLFWDEKQDGYAIYHRGSVRKIGLQLHIGDGQEDRDAVERDLERLPEEWRGLVRY